MPSPLLINSTDYFSEVVDEGLAKRRVQSPPQVKSYLVNMLKFYLDSRNLFDESRDELGNRNPQTLAELYLKASTAEVAERTALLKKLADRSLYISGYFGDSLDNKLVDLDYYAEMGGAAYDHLASSTKEDHLALVYSIFSKKFLDFVDVLTYISQKSFIKTDESILKLYDRYLRTGSDLAREKLIEMGVVALSPDMFKLAKQD